MNDVEQEIATKILAEYQKILIMMETQKTPHKEVKPLTTQDIMFLKAKIHPTAKASSKEMTRELLQFIHEKRITVAAEIYEVYGWSDNPVMKRLRVFREFGLVRRISKKYYLATPRLDKIVNEYLDRVCE